MLHRRRFWRLTSITSPDELAHKLTQYTWTCCTAISFAGYLFANDATSADGAQEFAILKPANDGSLIQIESITFSWCSEERALALIQQIVRGDFDSHHLGVMSSELFQTSKEHGLCHFCA